MDRTNTSPTIFNSEPRTLESFTALVHSLLPEMTAEQIRQLMAYRDLLHTVNQKVNLTAVRDFDGIERRLILESLRLVPTVCELAGEHGRVLDLGSGGGIPGIILATALPNLQFTLLDATGKKVRFQQDAIDTIGLTNTVAVQARAEELGHDLDWRNAFDVVTARAVTSLSALMELGLPFVSIKGWLVLPKGLDIEEEMSIARSAAGKLGGTIVSADVMHDANSDVETRLVLVRKDQSTPVSFPRKAGLPARSPLGSPQDKAERNARRRRSSS